MTEPFQLIEGDVLLRDAAGNPVAVRVDGNFYQLASSDQATHDLLSAIVVELKKMNVHMAMLNGEAVENADVE